MSSIASQQPEWLSREERGSVAVIRLIVWVALSLGRPVARIFLMPICLYFLLFWRDARSASFVYLARVLGRRPSLIDVFRHFHTFASCVLDRVFFLKDRDDLFDLRIHNEEIVTGILAEGGGCILLGAHMGSFEALRAAGRRQPRLRVNMVMFEENARKVSTVLNAINPELAKDVISLGHPDSFITVQRCLEAGNCIGILADRSLNNERQVAQPFLGAPANFSVNPFRVIGVLQKPVILMIALYRGGRRYDIHFEQLASVGEIPRRPNPEALNELMGRYVQRLEHYCRIAPYNWFNFYDIWN
jgi:predicted LPLAT superfamily acyltransferase